MVNLMKSVWIGKRGGRCQRRPWGAPPPPPPQYKVWAAADAGGVWQHGGLQSLVFGCGAL